MLEKLRDDHKNNPEIISNLPVPSDCEADCCLVFNADQVYKHHIVHFNYTTYDIRCSQDTINVRTLHSNIMVLAQPDDDEPPAFSQPPPSFHYAKVLGTYHVNLIYIGPGSVDFTAHRFEFLWVRWYGQVGHHTWADRRLDRVRFMALNDPDAFGFLDPADVIRGCHIIPHFALGKLHEDSRGLLFSTGDSGDWKEYYISR